MDELFNIQLVFEFPFESDIFEILDSENWKFFWFNSYTILVFVILTIRIIFETNIFYQIFILSKVTKIIILYPE